MPPGKRFVPCLTHRQNRFKLQLLHDMGIQPQPRGVALTSPGNATEEEERGGIERPTPRPLPLKCFLPGDQRRRRRRKKHFLCFSSSSSNPTTTARRSSCFHPRPLSIARDHLTRMKNRMKERLSFPSLVDQKGENPPEISTLPFRSISSEKGELDP